MNPKKPTHIRIHVSEKTYSQYPIQRGKTWTPTNSCVEYADYYEIANYTWYARIDKQTLQITGNFRNVDVFELMSDRWAVVY